MRVVIDTNVLASGLVNAGSVPGNVLSCWSAGLFELVISEHILQELARTLGKPYFRQRLSVEQVFRFLQVLKTDAISVPLQTGPARIASHPEDDLVLATAADGDAIYMVSGDKQLLALGRVDQCTIVSPAEFLAFLFGE